MNNILKDVLYKFALVYLDDIIIFSKSIKEHLSHLDKVFELLEIAGLKLKRKKCEFFKEELDYLGYIVSRKGITPNLKKLKAIIDYPAPKNTKELSSFLGLASYYRKFIRAFADKAHPLTALTKKSAEWKWGESEGDAFNCIKNCLITRPILSYPDFSRDFIIYTDASGYGIGAVLAQIQSLPQSADSGETNEPVPSESDDTEVVIAYSSKHLNDREAKWSTTEKEAYAIVHAIDVFRTYLYGRKFTVYTDHRPLEWLMSKTEPAGRLARWALKIQEYDIVIGYRPDVTTHVNSCLRCARRKASGATIAPLQPLPPVDRVWQRIAMDIVGPIQESVKGYKYILVLSDYASRFVFAFPMKNQTAQTIASIMVNKVITKYGAPEIVLTDQGTNFLSSLVQEMCKLFKIKQMRTTAYHPQTDGLVERFNRTLCDMLACYVVDEPEEWDKYLPFVTLAYNTSQQATLKDTPFYLFFGREPILPNDIKINRNFEHDEGSSGLYYQKWRNAQDLARSHLFKAQTKQKGYYDERAKGIAYKIGDLVMLKAPPSADGDNPTSNLRVNYP
ncbi:uncharacterized protein LOC130695755 [Daphnia carinata]|uniref:uncharacterized protein LOC130695755 n=1 Tax=Daphnia carinata TaxID=120202 RepID=UPI00257B13EC|nr:uncharacterized protein LOC130695755 [Daphnia carinata]